MTARGGTGLWCTRRRLRLGAVVPVRAAAQGKHSGQKGGSRSEEGVVIENGGGGCLFIKHLGN